MAANPSETDRLKLSPEEARMVIKAIEDVEREEAEALDSPSATTTPEDTASKAS